MADAKVASRCAARRLRAILGAGSIVLACLSCSGKSGPQVGGESHWLATCKRDRDCGGEGLSCVCGACTLACSNDMGCGSTKPAACYNTNSPLLLQRCEA